MIKEGRYTIKHLINMGNFESVTIEYSALFDIDEMVGSVEDAFGAARSHIDKTLKQDLERAAQCTALGTEDTYVHEWIEEVY